MNQTKELFQELKALLDKQVPPLKRRKESADSVEYAGTKEAMQGKQKVDGYYFASIVTKPADIRFYFFPLYTHLDSFPELSPQLKKFLKGKTCFHVKSLDKDLNDEISEMIEKGVQLYVKDGLI